MENTLSPSAAKTVEKVCIVCGTTEPSLSSVVGCLSGEHFLCMVCIEKVGAGQNGCIVCGMLPSNEPETAVDVFSSDQCASSNVPEISEQSCCVRHPSETAYFFCMPCNRPACDKCIIGLCSTHRYVFVAKQMSLSNSEPKAELANMLGKAKARIRELENSMHEAENATMQLRVQFSKARLDVDAAYAFFSDQLRERRAKLLNEIDTVFNIRWQRMSGELQEVRSNIDNLQEFITVVDTIILTNDQNSVIASAYAPLQAKLQSSLNQMLLYQPKLIDAADWVGELEFMSNRQAMQAAVQNCLGYVRHEIGSESSGVISMKQASSSSTPVIPQSSQCVSPGSPTSTVSSVPKLAIGNALSDVNGQLVNADKVCDRNQSAFWPNDLGGYLSGTDSAFASVTAGSFSVMVGAEKKHGLVHTDSSESWPLSGLNGSSIYQSNDSLLDSLSQTISQPAPAGLSTIKRQKMGYHCKFGEFGSRPGQFTEPSGIATNILNDIIVADTNNHRLEVFDATGVFKYEILGRQADCELVYPNRLAVCRTTGDIIVTERSPTHQVQVFDRCGNFLRRFGGKVLQHPRGVAVDIHERIVVVECRVMRVVIFDVAGAVINRFSLMGELEFPNGVAVDDNEYIYISDNRAHCVKVYNYTGAFVRTIGGAGITNYPIGVGVDRLGRVVVADNHNNFNVTVFDSDGTLIRALESRVKHAHCYDMALTGDGDIVVSSKDFRVYVYRYETASTNPEGMTTTYSYLS